MAENNDYNEINIDEPFDDDLLNNVNIEEQIELIAIFNARRETMIRLDEAQRKLNDNDNNDNNDNNDDNNNDNNNICKTINDTSGKVNMVSTTISQNPAKTKTIIVPPILTRDIYKVAKK
jgi:hypothetical protein